MEQKSMWQTRQLAGVFLNDVRGAIPGADMQMNVIGAIVDQWCNSPSLILDLGCGNGILGRFLLDRFPSAKFLLTDFSDPMLNAARENIGVFPDVTIAKSDFSTPEWLDVVKSFKSFDIIVSGFAIHHQPDERKQQLYSEIFDLLNPGGVFFNLEHVASATKAGEEVFDEFFIDHLYSYHSKSNPDISRDTITTEYYKRPDKEENLLASVEEQCKWLRDIGFKDVDCFFKIFELTVFGGRKK